MPIKFSAHLDTLLPNLTPEARLRTLAGMGFTGVELWGHWNYPVPALARAAVAAGVTVAALVTELIPLTDHESHDAYLAGLKRAIAAAKILNCRTIISQVGNRREGVREAEQRQAIVDGLRAAAPLLEAAELTLVIEPLNVLVDHPGYFLTGSGDAAEILAEVASPAVRMLFDIYHQQISEGNLINNITRYLPYIGHFHFADHPGRHQPGTGEINFANVFRAIAASSYDGWVGMEFWPQGEQPKVLEQFRREFMFWSQWHYGWLSATP
ncbi:MAG: TIM barrel protein [Victivallales bacterium]|nr:TIM barrel protein [Victivallales bacterium]